MFSDEHQTFRYASGSENLSSGVAGGGIVALALGGEHNSEIARRTGDWILRRPFHTYNRGPSGHDRFHYSAYYCSQAMFQLGGDYWTRFYPPLMKLLVDNQNEDGSWDAEAVALWPHSTNSRNS